MHLRLQVASRAATLTRTEEDDMWTKAFLVLALGLIIGLLSPPAARAEVNVNINVGPPPPPPIVLASPPRLVVVPGAPVYYAPDVSFNVFVFGGGYYSFHEGRGSMRPRIEGRGRWSQWSRCPRQSSRCR